MILNTNHLRSLTARWIEAAAPPEVEDGSSDPSAAEARGERSGMRAGLKKAAGDLNAVLNKMEEIEGIIYGDES